MIEIVNGDGSTTMTWDTYAGIMRERYNNGKWETWNLVIGTLQSEIDRTLEGFEQSNLQHVLELLMEVRRAHYSKIMG